MPLGLGFFAAAGAGGFALTDDYIHIETFEANTNTSNVTFSSIPQTYKHLQIRHSFKSGQSGNAIVFRMTCNGLTTAIYDAHSVITTGSGSTYNIQTGSNYFQAGYATGAGVGGATPACGVIDIFDYTATTKFKSVRNIGGGAYSNAREVALIGGVLGTTQAISSLTFSTTTPGEFLFSNTGGTSRISLYGIRG